MLGTLALTPVLVSQLNHAQYGAFVTISGLAGIAGVTDLGVGAGLVAALAHTEGRGDLAEARCLVSTAWWSLWGLGVALAGLSAVGAMIVPWDRVLGLPQEMGDDVRGSILAFGLALGLGLPFGIGDRVLTGTQRGARATVWALAANTGGLAAAALAACASNSLWPTVAASGFTPRLIGAIQTRWTLKRTCPELMPSWTGRSKQSLQRLGSAGAMFLVQGLAITLAFDSDMLVVSNVLGAEEAGVYGLNLRVVTMVGAFALSGFSQLFPAFGEALSGGDNEWVRNALRRLTCWLATYSVAVALILFWMEPIFVHEWVGEALVSSKSLLLALIVWGAYTTVLIPVNMFLNAALVIRMQIFTAIAMAAVNLPLSIALARSIGVSGPAWGSLIAHVSVSLVPTIIVARRLLAKTRPV